MPWHLASPQRIPKGLCDLRSRANSHNDAVHPADVMYDCKRQELGFRSPWQVRKHKQVEADLPSFHLLEAWKLGKSFCLHVFLGLGWGVGWRAIAHTGWLAVMRDRYHARRLSQAQTWVAETTSA